MFRYNPESPIYQEMVEANREAFINRQIEEMEREIKRIKAKLPWWARLYLFIISLRWRS